jgi:octaprenyl-diphosphate synthase
MDQQYTRRLENIEAALERWLPEHPDPAWAAEVFPGLEGKINTDLLGALIAPGKDLLARGGKRWRPLLMTLICEALGGTDAALPLAPLVEFCHNASLIHDDIEDNSDQRRGGPAIHIAHGVDVAINGGCFLYFLPLALIESWAAGFEPTAAMNIKNRVYALWAEYMRRLHLGQAMDIHWHRNVFLIPGIEEYYTMCGLKTGCLARFAAELGVCAAYLCAAGTAARPDMAAAQLGMAAEKLGVGFQILDDVKNLTTGIPGKKRGDDVVEGKKSLPVLLYLRQYPEQQKTVARCFSAARIASEAGSGVAAPEVEELIHLLEAAGALSEAQDRAAALVAEAREVFTDPQCAGFSLTAEGRTLLAGLIDQIS